MERARVALWSIVNRIVSAGSSPVRAPARRARCVRAGPARWLWPFASRCQCTERYVRRYAAAFRDRFRDAQGSEPRTESAVGHRRRPKTEGPGRVGQLAVRGGARRPSSQASGGPVPAPWWCSLTITHTSPSPLVTTHSFTFTRTNARRKQLSAGKVSLPCERARTQPHPPPHSM